MGILTHDFASYFVYGDEYLNLSGFFTYIIYINTVFFIFFYFTVAFLFYIFQAVVDTSNGPVV